MRTLPPILARGLGLAIVAAALVAALAPRAGAQQLTPRAPGLWQIDSQTQMTPPGQQSKDSQKLSITPELARRDFAPPSALQEDGWTCQSTGRAGSANRMSYAVDCRQGSDRAKGTGEVLLAGPKAFSGKTRIEADMEGMKVVVLASFEARFLDAQCGQAPLLKWEGFSETPRR